MNTIDKLIYNTLLQHKSLLLPSVGTLVVERVPSKKSKPKTISAPAWRVYFSKNSHENAISLEELIMKELNLDAEATAMLYQRWMIEAKDGSDIIIDEVGKISNGFFHPAKSFFVLINPFVNTPIKMEKKGICMAVKAVIAASIVVLCGLGYFYTDGFVRIREIVPETALVVPASMLQPIIADTTAQIADSMAIDTATNNTNIVATPTTSQQPVTIEKEQLPSSEISANITYHIVGGVFSTAENADKCVSTVKSKNDKLPVSKIPFKGDKMIVSIYSSQSLPLVEAKKIELLADFPDIWIYKQDRGKK